MGRVSPCIYRGDCVNKARTISIPIPVTNKLETQIPNRPRPKAAFNAPIQPRLRRKYQGTPIHAINSSKNPSGPEMATIFSSASM